MNCNNRRKWITFVDRNVSIQMCVACGVQMTTTNITKCGISRCKTLYCGQECADAHWSNGHWENHK
jgi:hypothetical protein